MEKLTLSNGTVIDAIGFGTFKITDELTEGRTREIMRDALEVGYRYFDTAAFYGNEKDLGDVIQEYGIARDELFIATKVWKTELGYDKTAASIDASLERLSMDYVDLLLVHWPKEFPGDPDWKEKLQGTWKAMEQAYRDGKAKNLGMCNCLPHHIMAIKEVAEIQPVINQLELHVGYMQQATVDYCRSENILPQAWSPLGRTRIFQHPTLKDMAERYDCEVPELLLNFLLQQGFAIIPKANSKEHMLSNLNLKRITISDEDVSVLLTMPRIGWAGEHPDYIREEVDNRYK